MSSISPRQRLNPRLESPRRVLPKSEQRDPTWRNMQKISKPSLSMLRGTFDFPGLQQCLHSSSNIPSARPILGPMATPTTTPKLSPISVNQLRNQCQLSSQKVLVYTEDKHVKQTGSQSSASPQQRLSPVISTPKQVCHEILQIYCI